jgi:putative transposase
MRSLLLGYARRYNAKYGTSGALFQGRFRAKLVHDEAYLTHLSRYIHLNPDPFADYRKYRWSSYRQYANGSAGISDPGPVMDLFDGSKTSYATYVAKAASPGE